MHPIAELKQLREQLAEQLSHIPEYQALKAMDRFIAELTSIYQPAAGSAQHAPSVQKQAPSILEPRPKSDAVAASSPRVTPYVPAHRVA
ncbi:MAG: hypothetical protein C3F11_11125 [Methylocystaceae bacterium]|nr:MAG: hypothetical protein C3F11_11125 [Methylocystaceae bacterium]